MCLKQINRMNLNHKVKRTIPYIYSTNRKEILASIIETGLVRKSVNLLPLVTVLMIAQTQNDVHFYCNIFLSLHSL